MWVYSIITLFLKIAYYVRVVINCALTHTEPHPPILTHTHPPQPEKRHTHPQRPTLTNTYQHPAKKGHTHPQQPTPSQKKVTLTHNHPHSVKKVIPIHPHLGKKSHTYPHLAK